MEKLIKFLIDYFKRVLMDMARKLGRLKTPMDTTIDTLRSFNSLPQKVVALEVFGMYGLWHTRDYFPICSYLEIYEWDKTYFKMLQWQYRSSVCIQADTVKVINDHQLKKEAYNFIVVDNPMGDKFGDNYFEHFNIFENLVKYTEANGVMILNFIISKTQYIDAESLVARKNFYGTEFPTIEEAIAAYRHKIVSVNRGLKAWHYIPRNDKIGYVCLIIS